MTAGTVHPWAVGVDIGCRVSCSLLDTDVAAFESKRGSASLERALTQQTQFGVGAKLQRRADHAVLDDDRWTLTKQVTSLRERARDQLGTSGSGNHFCDLGVVTLERPGLGLAPGRYVALLSHSGSRGTGAQIADHYSKLARTLHPELPKELSYLAWLDLDHEAGQEYFALMNLMNEYASANHAVIHQRVSEALHATTLASVENSHNLCWLEERNGTTYAIHRKGATPAAAGELGVIPGSMATAGFIVEGLGNEESLKSASHGAGRRMSRTAARAQFNWKMVRLMLKAANVKLLSGGIDESPGSYKDIFAVIAAQKKLINVVARFDPRIVRMADAGERPED
jgi:tRNA-splicing ligase RtcB